MNNKSDWKQLVWKAKHAIKIREHRGGTGLVQLNYYDRCYVSALLSLEVVHPPAWHTEIVRRELGAQVPAELIIDLDTALNKSTKAAFNAIAPKIAAAFSKEDTMPK